MNTTEKLAFALLAAANYIDAIGGVSAQYRQTLAAYEAEKAQEPAAPHEGNEAFEQAVIRVRDWLQTEQGVYLSWPSTRKLVIHAQAAPTEQAALQAPAPSAAPAAEAQRSDGMPASADERHLRRLLAARVGMPQTYFDDGEAQGAEHGISIDFMREPVAHLDAKLRALNVARYEVAKAAPMAQAAGQELPPLPLVTVSAECPAWNAEQMHAYARAAVSAALAQRREPLTDERILMIGRRALDKCTGTDAQHIYIAREVERACAQAPAQHPTQGAERVPLTCSQVHDLCSECYLDWHLGWSIDEEPNRYLQLARAIERAHGISASGGEVQHG